MKRKPNHKRIMLKINNRNQLDQSGEQEIIAYALNNEWEKLKAVVSKELLPPFNFDVELPVEWAVPDPYFFMPFFKVVLNIEPHVLVEQIVAKVSERFSVEEWNVLDEQIHLQCFAHEGPYAQTASDVVHNINELLGPFTIQALCDMGLDVTKLQFILTSGY